VTSVPPHLHCSGPSSPSFSLRDSSMVDADRISRSTPLYDIFLSHASSDKVWVCTLCDALQGAGLAVFLDEQQLDARRNYVGELNDALRGSRFLVLIASPHAALSAWVTQEWTAFLAEHGPRDRIVVVLLAAVEIPTLLKLSSRSTRPGVTRRPSQRRWYARSDA